MRKRDVNLKTLKGKLEQPAQKIIDNVDELEPLLYLEPDVVARLVQENPLLKKLSEARDKLNRVVVW